MNSLRPHLEAQIYPAHVIAVIVGALSEDGVTVEDALRHSGIDAKTLHTPSTRLSMQQMLTVCHNAIALSDPLFALRAGARMHIAACGIYGYALLSSPTHAQAAQFALKYDRLLGQFIDSHLSCNTQHATWTLTPIAAEDPSSALYRFLMEFKLTSMLTVMRDLYGNDFCFSGVQVSYKAPAHAAHYRHFLGCEVAFDQASNALWFDARLMEHRMNYADPITNATVQELCEQALRRQDYQPGTASTVHAMLIAQPGRFPGIEGMATRLGVNERTLRRKLEAEGTSYRQILTEVRTRLAMSYLQTTDLTTEEIAHRLGYSDPANFRNAFVRWTHASPSEFRTRTEPPTR